MRQPILKETQVQVFRRDRWLCRWCGCPVIFAPVMRYLGEFVKQEGWSDAPAYYNRNWRRTDAPLLDHMGAVIDHVEAHSGGGASVIANLATACNKCNARKSNSPAEAFSKRRPRIPVKGKYGDPLDWDGLSTIFAILIAKNPGIATSTERAWLRALRSADLIRGTARRSISRPGPQAHATAELPGDQRIAPKFANGNIASEVTK
jgi:5-methylcytosine-specific restriction endonuclease McrA